MLLELEHVEKIYETPDETGSVPVLRDVSLTVMPGESIAVVGPSGSGKSTLLNIIGALDRPTSGTVMFARRDLVRLSDTDLAALRNREIGFVFQQHHLLPQCTVIENVLVPTVPAGSSSNANEAADKARRLLERVGLDKRMDYRPSRLSGGERQRVALVRALINEPTLLLADEPTGSLDQHSADEVSELLVKLNEEHNTTLIVVTHSNKLACRMSRRLALREGRLEQSE